MIDMKKILCLAGIGMILPGVLAAGERIAVALAGFRPQGGNAAYIRSDAEVTYDGQDTLLFDMPDFVDIQVQHRVPVRPQQLYRVTVTVQMDCPYIEERGFGGLRLIVSDPQGEWLGWTPPLTARRDGWTEYDLVITSGDYAETVLLWHAFEGKGRLRVGAITLEEISAAETGNVTPPDPALANWPHRQGLQCFPHSPEDMFYPTRVPRPEELQRKLAAAGARGETVNAALGVFASEALTGVSVQLSGALRHTETDAEIAPEQVEIRYLKPEKFSLDLLRHREYGAFLRPNEAIAIPEFENRRFFVTLDIPEDALPGIYTGSLRIGADRLEAAEVPFEVEVYPFALPSSRLTWLIYHNGGWEERIARDMARHGMNSASLYEHTPAGLEQGIAAMTAGGLAQAGHPPLYLYCNAADWTATFVPPLERLPGLRERWRQTGWEELPIYCVDEPNSPERIAEAEQAIAELRRAETPVTITTAIGEDGVRKLAPLYDRLIFDMMALKSILPYRVPGQSYWVYECRMNGKSPRVDRYSYGVFPYAAGATGAAQWVYADSDRPKDGWTGIVYGYVLIEDDDLVPSVGWEAKRTGINDHRYIELVESLLARVPDPAAPEAIAAAELLREIREKIDPNSFRARKERMLGVEFLLDNTPEPAWPERQMELWRRQLAQHIITLQEMAR